MHAAGGLGAALLRWVPGWGVAALALLAAGVSVPLYGVGRRLRVMRPHETAVSGATWYGVGVAIACLLFPAEAAFVGWTILAAGDGAAPVAGRYVPLVRWAGGKRSAGGTIAFFVAACAAAWLGLAWWHGGFAVAGAWRVPLTAGVCAIAEALLVRVDDNIHLPSVGAAVFMLTGLV